MLSAASDPLDERRFPVSRFVDLLFLAGSRFPFSRSVRAVVSGLLVVLTWRRALLWLRVFAWRLGWKWIAVVLLLTLSSYPALEGLYAGQLGLLVAFLLPASVLALQRNRFLLAGILMALTTIKPQEMGLLILYFFSGACRTGGQEPLLRGIRCHVGAAGGNFAGGDAALDSFLDQYGHGLSRLQSGTSGKDGSDFPVGAATCRSGSIVRHGRVPHRCRIRGLAASRRWRRIIRILAHDGPAALHYHDRHSSRAGDL